MYFSISLIFRKRSGTRLDIVYYFYEIEVIQQKSILLTALNSKGRILYFSFRMCTSKASPMRSCSFLADVMLLQCLNFDKLSFVDFYFIFKEQASFITFFITLPPPNLELHIDVLDNTRIKFCIKLEGMMQNN